MRAYRELVIANAKSVARDRMALFWFLAFPVLFVFLFGAIYSGSTASEFDIGLVSDGQGVVAETLSGALGAAAAFTVHVNAREKELQALEDGHRHLVIVLSPGADELMGRGQPVPVTLHYDQGKQFVNDILMSIIGGMFNQIERQVTGRPDLFRIERQAVQAFDLRMIDYLLPGVLAMAIMQLGLFGSLLLVGLRERKILRQLSTTPLPRGLLIGSEVTVRLVMALVQAMLIVTVGYLAFDVVIQGSWLAVTGIVLLGAGTFVSMGYMLVSFVRSEESGQGIIQMVQFPMMFLSGIFFPVDVMPGFLRPLIKAMPLTYLGDALRQVMAGVAPAYPLNTNLLVLVGWLTVSLVVALRFFRWE